MRELNLCFLSDVEGSKVNVKMFVKHETRMSDTYSTQRKPVPLNTMRERVELSVRVEVHSEEGRKNAH